MNKTKFKFQKGGKCYIALESGKVQVFKVQSTHPTLDSIKIVGNRNLFHITSVGSNRLEALTKTFITAARRLEWRVDTLAKDVRRLKESQKRVAKIETQLRKELAK